MVKVAKCQTFFKAVKLFVRCTVLAITCTYQHNYMSCINTALLHVSAINSHSKVDVSTKEYNVIPWITSDPANEFFG